MSNNFRVGQKVVCVDPCPRLGLMRHQVYTISRIGVFIDPTIPMLDVAEIETTFPYAWDTRRFRPAVERKTDISIFTRMLTDNKVDA